MTPDRERSNESAHLPGSTLIDAYGNSGFRFGGMSHRGSILCLPSGIWAWRPTQISELDRSDFDRVSAEADSIEILLVGSGDAFYPLPPTIGDQLRCAGLRPDIMTTGAAIRTYNVLLGEGRSVAAALIAVD